MTIYTIGYEATTMAEFLVALTRAGVKRVIDVRALPLSRRPGFSKSSLAASLKETGIDYVHLKALGTPKPGRDAAKKGDIATLRAVYAEQLELPEAQAQAAIMMGLAAEMPSALLCYERDPCHCHRTLLLTAVGGGSTWWISMPEGAPAQAASRCSAGRSSTSGAIGGSASNIGRASR